MNQPCEERFAPEQGYEGFPQRSQQLIVADTGRLTLEAIDRLGMITCTALIDPNDIYV